MDVAKSVEKAQQLSDIELAMLLCLMTKQNCLFVTDAELIGSLKEDIRLVKSLSTPLSAHKDTEYLSQTSDENFGLTCASVICSRETTLDDFRDAMLIDSPTHPSLDMPRVSQRQKPECDPSSIQKERGWS